MGCLRSEEACPLLSKRVFMYNPRLNELGLKIARNLKFEFDNPEWEIPFLIREIRRQKKNIVISENYISKTYEEFAKTEKYQTLEKKVGNINDFLFEQIKEENFKDMSLDRDAYHTWNTNLFYTVNKNPEKFQVIYEFVFEYDKENYYLKFKVKKGLIMVKSFHPNQPK